MESYQVGTGEATPQNGQFFQNIRQKSEFEVVTKTVNIAAAANVKDAAGSTVVIDLPQTPILDEYGGEIGSFWGMPKNLQYSAKAQAVTETDGAADFGVYDANIDLEKIFEGNSKARYMAKLTDGASNVLWGWIGGIAVASNVYTFSVYSDIDLGTQNWFQQDATAFALSNGVTAEIYRYASSFAWGSTDTFTEEVPYNDPDDSRYRGQVEFRLMAGMTNGQYAIDYKRGRIFARKANADDTETVTYRAFGTATLANDIIAQSTTAAGGAVAISATTLPIKYAIVQAPSSNGATVYIGDSGLNAAAPTVTATGGIELTPGASAVLENVDLANVYMDVTNDNDDVVVFYTR